MSKQSLVTPACHNCHVTKQIWQYLQRHNMGWLRLKTTKKFVKHTTNVCEKKRLESIKMKTGMTLAKSVAWKFTVCESFRPRKSLMIYLLKETIYSPQL